MFTSRGKYLTHLALQKASKGFGEYKKSDYMVVDTKVNNTVANCSNRSDGKRNLIEDSDEDDDQFVCCYDEGNECEAVDIQTIEKVRNILTPPKSKKRIIVDNPDISSNYVEKEKDNQHKTLM